MELKLQNLTIFPEPAEGSNRTFMELKYGSLVAVFEVLSVLIVPLWN